MMKRVGMVILAGRIGLAHDGRQPCNAQTTSQRQKARWTRKIGDAMDAGIPFGRT